MLHTVPAIDQLGQFLLGRRHLGYVTRHSTSVLAHGRLHLLAKVSRVDLFCLLLNCGLVAALQITRVVLLDKHVRLKFAYFACRLGLILER